MSSLFDSSLNSLLNLDGLPDFTAIEADHIEPTIEYALNICRQTIESVLSTNEACTFEHIVQPIEEMNYQLARVWSPVSHMNNVMNNDALRIAYNNCLEKLSAFWSELGQNEQLYIAYKQVRENDNSLNCDQKRLLDLAIIDFELSGVGLPIQQRERYTQLKLDLSKLQAKFEENILDCSDQWHFHTIDNQDVEGIPDAVLRLAAKDASENDLSGWRFSLDFPTYIAVLSHARNPSTRKRFYDAWITRASGAGDHDSKFDNTPIIGQIMYKRQQLAELLNYDNFAQYSLAKKMATSGHQVEAFIRDLSARSRATAKQELNNLREFANTDVSPWDLYFWAERYREETFDISDETLRPYFPIDKALTGLFSICQDIFDIAIREVRAPNAWHEDVRMFEIDDSDGYCVGKFYVDLFARPKKRGGAWMDVCIGHNRMRNAHVPAVAYLVCNFLPPEKDQPALLTHSEIVTLFHEFGHTLHHLLSQVRYPGIAGISGVPWDAVELPSQFLENFAWCNETIPRISGHYQTGEAIPSDMFERLLSTKTFHAGLQSLRQLEFALFDMRIHREQFNSYESILDEVREEISVVPTTSNNRFANSFSHIFAGGYAAGYYSYKWAEVLSADAFSAFEESGILNAATGQRFKRCILERGGAVDAMQAFVDFRGREPSIDALVRHNGLEAHS